MTASPGPMIADDGLMNSFGTILVLSTRWPPPSSMCAWKLPATASSLPGRLIGGRSSTSPSGRPPVAGVGCGAGRGECRRTRSQEREEVARRHAAAGRLDEIDDPFIAGRADDGTGPRIRRRDHEMRQDAW